MRGPERALVVRDGKARVTYRDVEYRKLYNRNLVALRLPHSLKHLHRFIIAKRLVADATPRRVARGCDRSYAPASVEMKESICA